MTPEQFCFWLHGVLSVSKDDSELDKKIRSELEKVVGRLTLKDLKSLDLRAPWTCSVINPAADVLSPGTTTPPLSVHNDT